VHTPPYGGQHSWHSVERQKGGVGVRSVRVEDLLKQCRRNGLSPEQADALLKPARLAHEQGLPAEPVISKIEEGLAKKAPPEAIERVANTRLQHLQAADRLLKEQGVEVASSSDRDRLVAQISLTMESGLDPENIRPVLAAPPKSSRSFCGRLFRILSAGETLRLAGFSSEETQQIMEDCRTRNLNGLEIQRTVNYLLRQRRRGADFETIYSGLWRSSASAGSGSGHAGCADGSCSVPSCETCREK
jgi:DNA-binding transcriptional MerR regulator